jgi:hypothetical protein
MAENGPLHVSSAMRTIEIDGTVYEVLNRKIHGLKKDFAYIKDDKVYIYGGKNKDKGPLEPGKFYKMKGEMVYIDPPPEIEDNYSTARIVEYNNRAVIDAVNGTDESFKSIDRALLEQSDEFFAPSIISTDDVLKRIIKRCLAEKRLSLKVFRAKFKNDYDITNMKSALLKPSPMSIRYFNKWAEILDMNVTIVAEFMDCTGDVQKIQEAM